MRNAMPCLHVEAGKLLELLGPNVRHNLLVEHEAVTLSRSGGEITGRLPLGNACADERADCLS